MYFQRSTYLALRLLDLRCPEWPFPEPEGPGVSACALRCSNVGDGGHLLTSSRDEDMHWLLIGGSSFSDSLWKFKNTESGKNIKSCV